MSTRRGRIFVQWWIGCGVCGFEKCCLEPTKSASIDTMRSVGWSQSKSKGWVCPTCMPNVLVPAKYRKARAELARAKAREERAA